LGARLTNSDNTPAIRLYESIGFVHHDTERYYRTGASPQRLRSEHTLAR
jgi:ribosomal protein S18 acetylase RimI-like enzyme